MSCRPVDELQDVHYDVVLPAPDEPRLVEEGVLFEDEDLLAQVVSHLTPQIEVFRSLFGPRRRT